MGFNDRVFAVPQIRFLSPSETASRLGVSVKALRVYESRGLVEPVRTEIGRRAICSGP